MSWNTAHALRKKRRSQWIAAHGPCRQCGSYLNLEVDHIDPKQKKIDLGKIWLSNDAKRNEELVKCQVLCEKCHYKKSGLEKRRHGRKCYVQRKCRCPICVA